MTRFTVIGSGVVLVLAAWIGPDERLDAVRRTRLPALPDATLSTDMIERCMDVAREVDPDLAYRLQRIRNERSEQDFRRAMSGARHLVGLASLKQKDPKLYGVKIEELKLQARVDHLVEQLIDARRTASGVIAEIEQQLEDLVRVQVGLSLVSRGFYLIRLKDHVASLRDELDQAAHPANRRLELKRRYQELLDRVDAALVDDE